MRWIITICLLLATSVSADGIWIIGDDHDGVGREPVVIRQGDILQMTFWQGEALFAVDLSGNLADLVVPGEVMRRERHRTYTVGLSGFEWEIVLAERPATNVFSFATVSRGLTFYYQPALTPAQEDSGLCRPDSVVGSYAAYIDRRHNEYQTGKAFHVYRPRALTADGREVWCDLYMDSSQITVIVPQWLLDDPAVYPLIIDPYFGMDGDPASTQGGGDFDIYCAWTQPGTPSDTGIIDSAYIYTNWDAAYIAGVYEYGASAEATAFADYASDSVGVHSSGYAWHVTPWSTTTDTLHNQRYSLAIQVDKTGGGYGLGYDDLGAGGNCGLYGEPGSWGFPANLTGFTITNRDYGIYLKYTTISGGAPAATGQVILIN